MIEDCCAEVGQFAPGGRFIVGREEDAFCDGETSQQVEAGCGLTGGTKRHLQTH